MEEVQLNNYLIYFNNRSVIEKIKIIVDKVRYSGKYIDIVFVSATEEVIKEIEKWEEVDIIELEEETGIMFE